MDRLAEALMMALHRVDARELIKRIASEEDLPARQNGNVAALAAIIAEHLRTRFRSKDRGP